MHIQNKSSDLIDASPNIRSLTQKYKRSEKVVKGLEDMKQKLKQKREMKEYKIQINLQQKRRDENDRARHLKEKIDDKSRAKTTIEFENEQRKEITRLKHMDHEDNFKREKNLHNLYKVKLIEKIEEKKERAIKIKEQRDRISSLFHKRDQLKI